MIIQPIQTALQESKKTVKILDEEVKKKTNFE